MGMNMGPMVGALGSCSSAAVLSGGGRRTGSAAQPANSMAVRRARRRVCAGFMGGTGSEELIGASEL